MCATPTEAAYATSPQEQVEALARELRRIENHSVELFKRVRQQFTPILDEQGQTKYLLQWVPEREERTTGQELGQRYEDWIYAAGSLVKSYLRNRLSSFLAKCDVTRTYFGLQRFAVSDTEVAQTADEKHPKGWLEVYLREFFSLVDAQMGLLYAISMIVEKGDHARSKRAPSSTVQFTRVLALTQDQRWREFLEKLLSESGFSLVLASTVEEAINFIPLRVNLVLVDNTLLDENERSGRTRELLAVAEAHQVPTFDLPKDLPEDVNRDPNRPILDFASSAKSIESGQDEVPPTFASDGGGAASVGEPDVQYLIYYQLDDSFPATELKERIQLTFLERFAETIEKYRKRVENYATNRRRQKGGKAFADPIEQNVLKYVRAASTDLRDRFNIPKGTFEAFLIAVPEVFVDKDYIKSFGVISREGEKETSFRPTAFGENWDMLGAVRAEEGETRLSGALFHGLSPLPDSIGFYAELGRAARAFDAFGLTTKTVRLAGPFLSLLNISALQIGSNETVLRDCISKRKPAYEMLGFEISVDDIKQGDLTNFVIPSVEKEVDTCEHLIGQFLDLEQLRGIQAGRSEVMSCLNRVEEQIRKHNMEAKDKVSRLFSEVREAIEPTSLGLSKEEKQAINAKLTGILDEIKGSFKISLGNQRLSPAFLRRYISTAKAVCNVAGDVSHESLLYYFSELTVFNYCGQIMKVAPETEFLFDGVYNHRTVDATKKLVTIYFPQYRFSGYSVLPYNSYSNDVRTAFAPQQALEQLILVTDYDVAKIIRVLRDTSSRDKARLISDFLCFVYYSSLTRRTGILDRVTALGPEMTRSFEHYDGNLVGLSKVWIDSIDRLVQAEVCPFYFLPYLWDDIEWETKTPTLAELIADVNKAVLSDI